MKKVALSLTALALAATSGCAAFSDDTGTASDSGDGVTVAAAFYPLEFVASRVAGDHATIEELTTPGKEPHDLEPTIAETALIAEADLVIHEADFQPAIDAAIDQNAGGTVLDAAAVVDLLPFDEDAEHDHEHEGDEHADEHADEAGHSDEEEHSEEEHSEDDGHDHGEFDPHFWQDPLRMADLGDAVAAELAGIDPDHADDYEANAADLRTELEDLDERYATGLAGCERSTIVVSHDAFGYLAKYGVEVAPVAGLSPDAEPTPADLAELQQLIRTDGVTTVFSETLASPELTETLAQDAGVTTEILDPIEGLTDETADQDYLSLMDANLTKLRTANGCA